MGPSTDAWSRKPRHSSAKHVQTVGLIVNGTKGKGKAQKRKLPLWRAEVEPKTNLESNEDDDQLSN